LAYRSISFAVMQVFGFVFAGIGVAFAAAAALDLVFDLGWEATWVAVPAGIGFFLAGLGFVWLARQFKRAVDHFSPL
jgi:hypothetical protein